MKTLNPHNLIEGQAKEILITEGLSELYFFWVNLFNKLKKEGHSADSIDGFIAGYYLGNNVMLKEKYLEKIRTENKLNT